jgi:Spy/CpxP family protein refolding chaperone
MTPEIKVEIKTKSGILAYTSEDAESVINFIKWATKSSTQGQPKTTSKTQKTEQQKPQPKSQRKAATEKQVKALEEYIQKLIEVYGAKEVDRVLQENDIKLTNLTSAQLRRAYAILRNEFPDTPPESKKSQSVKEEDIEF